MLECMDKMSHDALLVLTGEAGNVSPPLVSSSSPVNGCANSQYTLSINELCFVLDNGRPIGAPGLHTAAGPWFKHQSLYSGPVCWPVGQRLALLSSDFHVASLEELVEVIFHSDNGNLPLPFHILAPQLFCVKIAFTFKEERWPSVSTSASSLLRQEGDWLPRGMHQG